MTTATRDLLDKAAAAGINAAKAAEAKQKEAGHKWVVTDGAGREVGRLYGLCGFAWVRVIGNTPTTKAFIKTLRKLRLYCPGNNAPYTYPWRKAYGGGIQIWCPLGTQDVDIKGAWAGAYAATLREAGVNAFAETRLD